MASLTPAPLSTKEAINSIQHSFSELCISDPSQHHHHDFFENPGCFCGYVTRLKLVLNTLIRKSSSPDCLPASIQTGLKGIAGDLAKTVETVSVYRKKSKIFVLINCKSLSESLQERTIAIGGWMALIESSINDHPELRKKIADLSREMKQAQFKVNDNEERVYCTLQKEGQGRRTTKAVQNAIVMDLARALGVDSDNHGELTEEIKRLKSDLSRSNSVSERRILSSLQRLLDTWSILPDIATLNLNLDLEEDVYISPFRNFLCPLTKEVMKEPVVLESSQTYEKKAIEYWLERCLEDGRDPTCPVTGQVLKSLELKPNIGLAGAIEEWVNRNVDMQMNHAVECLSEKSLNMDSVERVLNSVYRISEEHPSNRYRVRNAGFVLLLVKMLRDSSKSIGTSLRSKALMVLLSMVKDEESKKIMLEEGVTRLAIHSLIGSSEKEREYAVKLLLEFSSDEAYCTTIASEKGALVVLSTMAENLDHPTLSNLAEDVLKKIERVDENVQLLAAAGRFGPLISGYVKMAWMVGRMTLTSSGKEKIARHCANVLVELLSNLEGRAPSLQALYNLSGLDDNATVLVDANALPALTDVLFKNHDASYELNELAASTMANIVSNPGYWELASADKEGNLPQSELFVSNLLDLLSVASSPCQMSILHILCGIALSPQAAESVGSHIKCKDGIKRIIFFLEHTEVEHRTYAFRLTRILSERFGQDLAGELKRLDKLLIFKHKLLDNQSTDSERSDSARILSNLPHSEEIEALLDTSFISWVALTLRSQHHSSNGNIIRPAIPSMVEGLLGILLHFTKSQDSRSLLVIKEQKLMTIFCEELSFSSNPISKQLAALGLKNLSESGRSISEVYGPPSPRKLCSSLLFICGKPPREISICSIHNAPCEVYSQFCLLKSNSVKALVGLLSDDDTNVQIAAIEALSTLVIDNSKNMKRIMDELDRQGVVDAVVTVFIEVRPGVLQEKAIWMIERILRVEGYCHRYSLNQSLVRALVEAFRHGNANAKKHAQDALTNLKQLSAVSGKAPSQYRPRR